MSELTAEVAKAKEASAVLEAQYKNAQEDVNFAQMCVKNLQATLAVYKKEEKVEVMEVVKKVEGPIEEPKTEEEKKLFPILDAMGIEHVDVGGRSDA